MKYLLNCKSWTLEMTTPLSLSTDSSILIFFLQSFQPVGVLKFPSDQTDKFFSSFQYVDQTEQTWDLV